MHGLEADYAGEIDFVFLDIDDPNNADFKARLGYKSQPHMFLLDGDGRTVGEWRGRADGAELAAAFDELLAQ